jgi:small multidrug resistance pump
MLSNLPPLNLSQAWWVLAAAIVLEVGGSTCMRLSDGFSRPLPSVLIFVFYAGAFALNVMVVRVLGLGTTYAVWSGVGTLLTALIGCLLFGEPATMLKLASTGLIIAGVVGMQLASRAST